MRGRLAMLAAFLMLCAFARAEAAYIVEAGAVAALVDYAGESLIETEGIERIFEVRQDELYAAGTDGNYALYDVKGTELYGHGMRMIADAGGCLIFRRDGLCGAMNDAGQVIVAPEWTQLVFNGENGFLALTDNPLDDQPDEILYFEAGELPEPTGVYTSSGLRAFSEGRMAYAASDGQWGYLDARGRVDIPAAWMYAGDFENGVAIASDGEGFGLIDAGENEIVRPVYGWMARGEGLIAAQAFNGSVEVYSEDGTRLLFSIDRPVRQVGVVGAYVATEESGRTQMYDASGTCVCRASEDAFFSSGTGGQLIASDGAWGEACQWLLNPDGTAASRVYQRILPLCPDRYAFITMDGVEYYSDDLEGVQTSWDYASIRYGLMDGSGNELLPAVYREIRAAGTDRLLLNDGERLVFADTGGNPIRAWQLTVE